jgi:hypothetical protein
VLKAAHALPNMWHVTPRNSWMQVKKKGCWYKLFLTLSFSVVGEKAHTSAFLANMKVNEYCKTLCRKTYTPQQMEEFQVFFFNHNPTKHACKRPALQRYPQRLYPDFFLLQMPWKLLAVTFLECEE